MICVESSHAAIPTPSWLITTDHRMPSLPAVVAQSTPRLAALYTMAETTAAIAMWHIVVRPDSHGLKSMIHSAFLYQMPAEGTRFDAVFGFFGLPRPGCNFLAAILAVISLVVREPLGAPAAKLSAPAISTSTPVISDSGIESQSVLMSDSSLIFSTGFGSVVL